jgi:hypothetical protein
VLVINVNETNFVRSVAWKNALLVLCIDSELMDSHQFLDIAVVFSCHVRGWSYVVLIWVDTHYQETSMR